MKKILLSDVSLLQEQLNNSKLSFKEKLDTYKKLCSLDLDVIELGAPMCKTDEVLIKTICNCKSSSVLSVRAELSEDKIEEVYSLIKTGNNKQISLCIPVSPIQMEYSLGKKPKIILEMVGALIKKARSLCDKVEICLEDFTRAEKTFLNNIIDIALNSGVTSICLVDSVGDLFPDAFAESVKELYSDNVRLKDVSVFISCNDDFSLSVANSVASVVSGVNGIKVCAIKNSSFPKIEKVVSIIDTSLFKSGYYTDINKNLLKIICNQINGEIESKKELNIKSSDNEVLIQDLTITELKDFTQKRGYNLSGDDLKIIYEEFLRVSKKKKVNEKELEIIIATSGMQVKETYSLESFSVNTSNVLDSTASIVLKKGNETLSGLSYGNGPIDASFLALENIIGRHFELDDFELSAVTEGKEALGQAIVKLRNNGSIYSGRGLSTDIIGASIRAYLNALNKIIYEENN